MNTSTIVEISPLFHPLFSNITSPPRTVWIEGRPEAFQLIDRLPDYGFSVVGTRAPDRRSQFLVGENIKRLRGTPLIIISGMARGIDSCAHESALEVGLPTIAVLGCGIKRTYPPENIRLRKRIVEAGGLILSEFDPELEAFPGCFIQRNRLIAGMARATWIVQSGYRSGALNTAHSALKQGRTVFVTPSFPGDPSFLGNENLLTQQPTAIPFYNTEVLATCWIDLFSDLIRKKPNGKTPPVIDLLSEIESGLREGKSLTRIIEGRSLRTGESVEAIIQRIEKGTVN